MLTTGTKHLTGRRAIIQGASYNLRLNWVQENKLIFPLWTDKYLARLFITEEEYNPFIRSTGIAFVDGGASADTITHTGEGFVEAGFEAGDQIVVEGATWTSGAQTNNGIYTLATVTAGTLTLDTDDDLIAEAAGMEVAIYKRPLVKATTANFKELPWCSDDGNLGIGEEDRLTFTLTARETAQLNFDTAYWNLTIIPTSQDNAGPIVAPYSGFGVLVGTATGFATIDCGDYDVAEVFPTFRPGDEIHISLSENANEGRYTVMARGDFGALANGKIRLTDQLAGTDNAGDTTMVITRLIPNWGAAFQLLRGRVQLKKGSIL